MLNVLKSILISFLTQIIAIFIFAIAALIFDLDLYNLINDSKVSYLLHNVLIILIYVLITLLINQYFKSSFKLRSKSKILGFILLVAYLIVFYFSIQSESIFKYFLLIHYPIGSYFRTVPYSAFNLMTKISIILSIISVMLGVYIGQRISIFRNKKTKRKLNSLPK